MRALQKGVPRGRSGFSKTLRLAWKGPFSRRTGRRWGWWWTARGPLAGKVSMRWAGGGGGRADGEDVAGIGLVVVVFSFWLRCLSLLRLCLFSISFFPSQLSSNVRISSLCHLQSIHIRLPCRTPCIPLGSPSKVKYPRPGGRRSK